MVTAGDIVRRWRQEKKPTYSSLRQRVRPRIPKPQVIQRKPGPGAIAVGRPPSRKKFLEEKGDVKVGAATAGLIGGRITSTRITRAGIIEGKRPIPKPKLLKRLQPKTQPRPQPRPTRPQLKSRPLALYEVPSGMKKLDVKTAAQRRKIAYEIPGFVAAGRLGGFIATRGLDVKTAAKRRRIAYEIPGVVAVARLGGLIGAGSGIGAGRVLAQRRQPKKQRGFIESIEDPYKKGINILRKRGGI